MAGTPRTRAVFILDRNEIGAPKSFSDSGPPQAPQPRSGPCRTPSGAFVFLASSPRFFVLAVTFGILGAGYQNRTRPVLAAFPSPRPPVRQGEKPKVEASTIVNPKHVRLLGVIFWHIA